MSAEKKHPCEFCPIQGAGYEACEGCVFDDWDGQSCDKYECTYNIETVCIAGVSGRCKARHPEDFEEEDDDE